MPVATTAAPPAPKGCLDGGGLAWYAQFAWAIAHFFWFVRRLFQDITASLLPDQEANRRGTAGDGVATRTVGEESSGVT